MEGEAETGAASHPSVLTPFVEFPSGVPLDRVVETIQEVCQRIITAIESDWRSAQLAAPRFEMCKRLSLSWH